MISSAMALPFVHRSVTSVSFLLLTFSGVAVAGFEALRHWGRDSRAWVAAGIALLILAAAAPARATDRMLINGDGCQVTEEDAVGIFLSSDLYLRVDFPDSHWRFGLRNQGLKGMASTCGGMAASRCQSRR